MFCDRVLPACRGFRIFRIGEIKRTSEPRRQVGPQIIRALSGAPARIARVGPFVCDRTRIVDTIYRNSSIKG